MRWLAAGIAIVVLVVVGVAAWLFLPPPTSGPGWHLGPTTWHERAAQPGEASQVIVYAAGAEQVGIGVTVFGSSSCPPKLRDVRIGSAAIQVEVRGDLGFGACTADLAPHSLGILVERDALPRLPFTVVVSHAGAVDEHGVTELP
jgi:hypothetical protein